MWFSFEKNNDLWFNQTGQSFSTDDNDVNDESPVPLWEYGGQTPKSDIIDQFDPESGIII